MRRIALSLLLLCLPCLAGAADLRAGSAQAPSASVLALQSAAGGRVLFITWNAPALPHPLAHLIAARAASEFDLDRSELVFFPPPSWLAAPPGAAAAASDVSALISAAIASLAPAVVEFRAQSNQLIVSGASPEPLAVPLPLCGLAPSALPAGPLTGPIRSAFQVVELSSSLSSRASPPQAQFALQGLGFGKSSILILCGAAMPASLNAEARQRLDSAAHSMTERISYAPVRRD